ncbi:hypothetical protein PV327_001858 [Microctonus hyperodae]|uniref:Uncharacterized protein n=1 Tax=Microctonus hyperodae TaxID=165561 RepID=A0AA39FED1_MICHY|nr:hypothetical protein PV327_001858 [Microctonus hyperodae]
MPKFHDRCCNPMNLKKHLIKSGLRKISHTLVVRYNMSPQDRICSGCYKKLLHPDSNKCSVKSSDPETPPEYFENEQNVNSKPITDVNDSQVNTLTYQPTTSFEISSIEQSCSSLPELSPDIVSTINEALLLLNESPITSQKINMDTFLNE